MSFPLLSGCSKKTWPIVAWNPPEKPEFWSQMRFPYGSKLRPSGANIRRVWIHLSHFCQVELAKFTFSITITIITVLYNNMRILCVCLSVCLCVCPTWDIRNRRLYRHAAYIILKSFASWFAQTVFRVYMTHGLREKAFGSFSSVTRQIPCTHCYTSGYPGQDKSCPLQGSLWNILKGYMLKDMPST